MALVHELSHYVGGAQDTPNMIRDAAYGWVDAPRMKALLPWWRTCNARSFVNFAWESAFGVRPCGL